MEAFEGLIANPRLFTIYKQFCNYMGSHSILLEIYTDIYVYQHSSFKSAEEMLLSAKNIGAKVGLLTKYLNEGIIQELRDSLTREKVTQKVFDDISNVLYLVVIQNFMLFWRDGNMTKKQEKLLCTSTELKMCEFVNEVLIFHSNPTLEQAKNIAEKFLGNQLDFTPALVTEILRKIQNGQVEATLFHHLLDDFVENKKVTPKKQRIIPSKIWDIVK